MTMTHLGRFAFGLLITTSLTAVSGPAARAQTTANINAVSLLLGFSTLNSNASGQAVLAKNLAVSNLINSSATASVQAQGIRDNTLASLVGSLSNGLVVADGLGPQLYAAFAAKDTVAQNYSSTALSANFKNLFNQISTLTVASDNAVTKNYFANGSTTGNPASAATGITLPPGGIFNVYDAYYKPLSANANTVGDTRPYAVAPSSYVSFTAPDFFGVSTTVSTGIWATLNSNAAFPSGHATAGFTESMLLAMMVPERYQQLITRGAEFGNSRIVVGAHYALDVIGARIQSTYDLVQILNNNPIYQNVTLPGLLGGTVTTTSDFAALYAAATTDLRATLTAGCSAGIAACAAGTSGDRFASAAANQASYTYELTYGLPAVGPTNLDAVVPTGAEVLIASRFPYLTSQQQRAVLASTELASGQPLDDGSGYARLNLYSAANGYGALNGNVSVTMNASLGGFNAYDTWSNNIGNYVQPSTGAVTVGSLTKGGTGTLELSGANSWSGPTTINGGTLLFSGTSTLGGAVINNSVLSLTRQDGTAGRVLTAGGYTGGAGSQLAVAATLSGPGAVSDRLVLTGGITAGSTTSIVVSDTAPGTAASYNPTGMTVVSVAKGQTASAGAFTLANGPIAKGLFHYALAYNADPAWVLVGLPTSDAYRLATLPSAAQSLWFDTAGLRGDRQDELRDAFAADRKTSLANPIWLKAAGIWQDRTDRRTTTSYSSSFAADASYSLSTAAVVAGLDGGIANLLSPGDSLLVGFDVGSIDSTQSFKGSSDRATYRGATLGLSATYLKDAYFNDLSVKADLLSMSLSLPSLAGFGGSSQSRDAHTYGVIDTVGYRFKMTNGLYVEPLLTLAYAHSDIGSLSLSGSTASFPSADVLRGRIGVRAGMAIDAMAGTSLNLSGTASVWNRLSGTAAATINSGSSSPVLTLNDRSVQTFGEIGITGDLARIGSGWSVFGKANYQFATGYNNVSVEGGVRFRF